MGCGNLYFPSEFYVLVENVGTDTTFVVFMRGQKQRRSSHHNLRAI
jgi:hypothetical protein